MTQFGLSPACVLGAGFSKAISQQMPTIDELGESCRPLLEAAGHKERLPPRFTNGLFEQWLSRLATDQPDYSAATNAENLGVFARASEAIARMLDTAQRNALMWPCPPWLPELVEWFHRFESTVITFNYDNLIEYVVMSEEFEGSDGTERRRVRPVDILGDLPPYPPQPGRLGGRLVKTLQLLKLHGSLDWRWSPGDESGATLNRLDLTGEWEHPGHPDIEEIARRLPGREPFIVPPTAVKSPYYTNPNYERVMEPCCRSTRRDKGHRSDGLLAAHHRSCIHGNAAGERSCRSDRCRSTAVHRGRSQARN